MNENDSLQILIEASLDFTKSLETMTAQMNQLREKFKNYQIRITAGLNQTASAAQIKNDLKKINTSKNHVRLVGQMDQDATKKNVDSAVKKLKNTEIQLSGLLDTTSTQKNVQQQIEQLKKIPTVEAKADVNVEGAEQVDQLSQKMDKAGASATSMAANVYLARTALQALRRAAQEARDTIVELDAAATDLAIVTGSGSDEAYSLLQDYNQMAQQLGATTTQISDAAGEWLRQGKTAAETTTLIEQSMILSKVGAMESEEATKNLTSAMKGYGLAVEDVSGIVDKLTAIDLEAAVTASDLAVAMSRTANSANISGVSMDRLLGYLATVQEVTQKSAETIGESFKTIFARMGNVKLGNFMADDGEDLSDVETTLKHFGIALRDSEDEFRNFSDVLDDVYTKWDQFTNIDKRAIANAFAGTRQQENFLVLMENYGAALEYAGVAADSAGTALEKFSAYEDSIGAKAASFTAAMESLTMDTVDPGLVKDLIDAGTAIVGFVEQTGLLKSALVALGAGATLKGVKMIVDGFNSAKDSVLSLGTAINTLRNIEDVSSLAGDTISTLGQLTKGLSDEQIKLVLTSRNLTTAQMEAILTASGLTAQEAAQKIETLGLSASQKAATASTVGLSGAITGLGASIKAAFAANPIGMIMLAVSAAYMVAQGVAAIFDALIVTSAEAYEAAEEARNAYNETTEEIETLNGELETSQERLEELYRLSENGTITLVEQEELEKLREAVALQETQIANQQYLAEQQAKEANEGFVEAFNKENFNSIVVESAVIDYNALYDANRELIDGYNDYIAGYGDWWELDEDKLNSLLEQYGEVNNQLWEYQQRWDGVMATSVDYDTYVQELVDRYDELNGLQESGVALSEDQAEQMENVKLELANLMNDLSNNYLGENGYVGIDEHTEHWQSLIDQISQAIYPVEYFNQKLSELPVDCYSTLEELGQSASLTAEEVQNLANEYPELSAWMNEAGYTAEDVAAHFNALSVAQEQANGTTSDYTETLSDLKDTMSEVDSIYSVISDAQTEMFETGGVTADTISALADVTDDYNQYLEEENGKIRINIDALRELANSKVEPNITAIQSEIDALEDQNAELEKNIAYYEEQRELGNDGGLWSGLISQATTDIQENNRAIEENLALLGQYQAIQNPWESIFSTFDAFTNGMATIAEIQAEVANGFVISAEKAREFAAVYPEILANATTTSNGEIQLNAAVVNAFLSGKEAELKGSVEAQIAQLEAEKAVLTAKMEAAQAQLDLAMGVANGEGEITKELAEYRINAGNIVAQAMIDAGVDEATAFRLAAAAMSQNVEEFNRIAAQVCTDVNGNFNEAAYSAAQTMYNNLTNVKTDLASVASQAHETAAAIAGIASGDQKGSAEVKAGSGGGTKNGDIEITLTEGNFEGHEFTYEAKTSTLDDLIADLELDISEYESAISTIDSQIALLRSLGNTSISDYAPETTSKKTTGSTAEVEEYIADIDKYREAVERLRKAQEQVSDIELRIEESDDLNERILLTRSLIGAYEREQEALQDLNRERSATISAGVESLRELGFAVEYNAETNDLWISNLEHLNELTADNKGEYDSLQEATNALRENTEDLIDTVTNLNEENRDGTSTWKDVASGISDAREQITEYLNEIVEQASDAVDEIQSVYDTLHDAADEYANSGFVSVDTLQSISDMGQQYLAYLMDENGQLIINEERIRAVIAARTQQMAIESSLAYVEALRMAKAEGDIATLNNLLYATETATNATWGFVYANLALAGLDEDQYQAALHNINALRALADSAVQSIGQTVGGVTDELEEMEQGLTDILDYVMEMLKQRIQDQIDGLEDMKDAYSEIIELKKESLEASKDEADYQKSLASKMREVAKLQARIDALSLDDSREAQAERAGLLEELNELQSELADDQADRTLEAQEDALDKMEESYHDEKDREIAILEDSISSYQKLYDMAIEYIESHWDTLYNELIAWNTQYGDVLNSEITTAWDNCLAAAQRYGSYVSALGSISSDIEASQSTGSNLQVGNTNYDKTSNDQENIHAIIKAMYANGQLWGTASDAQKKQLADKNLQLGAMLGAYGITAVRGDDGVWYIDRVGGEELFKKYKQYIYHDGGIVGGGDVKSNEQISLLKDKEWVLSEQMVKNLTAQMDVIRTLADGMGDLPDYAGNSALADVMKQVGTSKTVNNVTNNSRPIELQIGDTIIHGADRSTVEQHIKVTRDMVNQIGRIIGIGR